MVSWAPETWAQTTDEQSELRFTLTQEGARIKITDTGGLSNYDYFIADLEPPLTGSDSCSEAYAGAWVSSSTGATNTDLVDGQWVCFRAQRTSNLRISVDSTGYAKLQFKVGQSKLHLTQTGNQVTASGVGLTDFEYFVISNNPACNQDATYTNSGQATGVIDPGHWVCFKAKNEQGVYVYQDMQVVGHQSSCADINDVSTCQGIETLDKILNFMALLVVPLCGILITVAGIQYMVSRGNPEIAAAARLRIYKVILALIMFAGLWTFLKWLIPGGVLEWNTLNS